MAKQNLADLTNLAGKRVLIRVDFNVPQDAAGNVTSDRRIRAALPTIQHVLKAGASAIVMSHLGRPKGDPKKDAPFKMDKVAARLGELLGHAVSVTKVDEVAGPKVEAAAKALKPGAVLVLENLRFHPGEQAGDAALGAQIAALGDVYVNDAFGTCHRKDASMVAVPAAMKGKPRVVGLLVQKELDILDHLLSNPPRPFVAILGGAKVSDKIAFIKALLARVDHVLIGGAMSFTFMKAQGKGVGTSKVEGDKLDLALELWNLGKGKMQLPVDFVVVEQLDKPDAAKVVEGQIPDGWSGVDIGPKTRAQYKDLLSKAGTIIWNGPVGKYEDEAYSHGTKDLAAHMAGLHAITVVGGGETADAVESFGHAEKMKHVSTGGGAFLEYVQGEPFPALAHIDDRKSS